MRTIEVKWHGRFAMKNNRKIVIRCSLALRLNLVLTTARNNIINWRLLLQPEREVNLVFKFRDYNPRYKSMLLYFILSLSNDLLQISESKRKKEKKIFNFTTIKILFIEFPFAVGWKSQFFGWIHFSLHLAF